MFLKTPEGLHTVKAAYLDAGFSFVVVFLFQFWFIFFPSLATIDVDHAITSRLRL